MRKAAIIIGALFMLGLFILATDSITTYLGESEYRQCYSLRYLHVSGTKQCMQMQMTPSESRRLHETIYYGVPVLAINAGALRERHVRVIGATGIISLTPCK